MKNTSRVWFAQWPIRAVVLGLNDLPGGSVLGAFGVREAPVLWKEGFEQDDFWDRWHVDTGGLWAVGTPSTGPGSAFAGLRCVATALTGNYPPSADTRMVRDQVFKVPAAADHPRLRFWHWWQGGVGDTRTVEIKAGAGAGSRCRRRRDGWRRVGHER